MTKIGNGDHPCFSLDAAHRFARLHLPVAPACNIQCAYCNRKYDCVNESRPGVTSAILSPEEAVARYREMKATFPNLRIVGVAGPGDALANPAATFGTFRGIRNIDREIDFCFSTNGVELVRHLDAIREIGIRYITMTINSRRLAVARTLYTRAWDGDADLRGADAARFVLKRQEEALDALRGLGVHLKINTIYIPGVNDAEIGEIVRYVKEKGADIVNIMPFIPTPGTWFENFPMVSRETLSKVQAKMAEVLPMMRHCRQCRADAVGNVLNERPVFVRDDRVTELPDCARRASGRPETGERLRFAVASGNGTLVDLHFGHAADLLVYDATETSITFVERREIGKYCPGPDACEDPEERMWRVEEKLSDCQGLLAMRIGDSPRRALEGRGVAVTMTCNRIEDAIREVYAAMARRKAHA